MDDTLSLDEYITRTRRLTDQLAFINQTLAAWGEWDADRDLPPDLQRRPPRRLDQQEERDRYHDPGGEPQQFVLLGRSAGWAERQRSRVPIGGSSGRGRDLPCPFAA
jgi:hypothetical protein